MKVPIFILGEPEYSLLSSLMKEYPKGGKMREKIFLVIDYLVHAWLLKMHLAG